MKTKEMPSYLAKEFVRRNLPLEGTIDRALAANRLHRAFYAGYNAARKRFALNRQVSKSES